MSKVTKEQWLEVYNDFLSLTEKISLWNTYCSDCLEEIEYQIESNDENFFNTFFEGKPMEAVRASYFGTYRYSDDYVWFNAYGNLNSGSYEDELPMNGEDMVDFYLKNPDLAMSISDEFNDLY